MSDPNSRLEQIDDAAQRSDAAQLDEKRRELQAQAEEVQREIDERQAKAGRLQGEIARLRDRGEATDSQQGSLDVVEEEVRVLHQRLAELRNLADNPEQALAADRNLVVGGIAQVAQDGGVSLVLRTRPDLDESGMIDRHPPGTQVTLLYGPEYADGHEWWRVRRMDGAEGWIASDGLDGRPA